VTPTVRIPPVLLLAIVLHTAVLPHFRIFGVASDILLLLAIAAGLTGGPDRGAVAGFTTGLFADLFLHTPFGLSALAYCLAGWGVGRFQSRILHATWWIPALTSAVGAAGGTLLYVVLGAVVGQEQLLSWHLPTIVAVVAGTSALLSPFTVRLARWAMVIEERGRLLAR
jgi:rod shape-determining protein MreD